MISTKAVVIYKTKWTSYENIKDCGLFESVQGLRGSF